MMWKYIIKPLWYDLNDYSRSPRTITMVIGFGVFVLAFMVFATVAFWDSVVKWVVMIPVIALVSAGVLYLIVLLVIYLWRNVPYWIEVWITEREMRSVEIIEYQPKSEDMVPWKEIRLVTIGLYAIIGLGLCLAWNYDFLYWSLVSIGILIAQMMAYLVQEARNAPKSSDVMVVIKKIGWQYAIWSITIIFAMIDGTRTVWILIPLAIGSTSLSFNKTLRKTSTSVQ